MGNLTPKPMKIQAKTKFNSKVFIVAKESPVKVEKPPTKKRYRKLKIMNIAPNCVQKNIK